MLRRSDKQPDRVEISPEQLSDASTKAEVQKIIRLCCNNDDASLILHRSIYIGLQILIGPTYYAQSVYYIFLVLFC